MNDESALNCYAESGVLPPAMTWTYNDTGEDIVVMPYRSDQMTEDER